MLSTASPIDESTLTVIPKVEKPNSAMCSEENNRSFIHWETIGLGLLVAALTTLIASACYSARKSYLKTQQRDQRRSSLRESGRNPCDSHWTVYLDDEGVSRLSIASEDSCLAENNGKGTADEGSATLRKRNSGEVPRTSVETRLLDLFKEPSVDSRQRGDSMDSVDARMQAKREKRQKSITQAGGILEEHSNLVIGQVAEFIPLRI